MIFDGCFQGITEIRQTVKVLQSTATKSKLQRGMSLHMDAEAVPIGGGAGGDTDASVLAARVVVTTSVCHEVGGAGLE